MSAAYFFDSSALDVVDTWVKKGQERLAVSGDVYKHEEPIGSGNATKGLGFNGQTKKEIQAASSNVNYYTFLLYM